MRTAQDARRYLKQSWGERNCTSVKCIEMQPFGVPILHEFNCLLKASERKWKDTVRIFPKYTLPTLKTLRRSATTWSSQPATGAKANDSTPSTAVTLLKPFGQLCWWSLEFFEITQNLRTFVGRPDRIKGGTLGCSDAYQGLIWTCACVGHGWFWPAETFDCHWLFLSYPPYSPHWFFHKT